MNSAIYVGRISHRRYLPKSHSFSYPFFMWYLDLEEVEQLPSMRPWFSATGWAFARFHRPDYFGDEGRPLGDCIKERMTDLTGKEVTGGVYGLLNLRTMGLYFSPVNFYFAFDQTGKLSHFLAEVSNIPWNERHQYGHYVADEALQPQHKKEFHVSPFNHMDQHYSWNIEPPGESLKIELKVDDARGDIFEARLELARVPLAADRIRGLIMKKPVMTGFIVAGIYWQALKLYVKGVPYLGYAREAL
ncbi:MAG: DUF1365 domain-containing protein [Desulfopila sp.]|jgi:DUF1365 family protein|nr:DUF1365 domain-containing protein [Desulfopila sp.]